MTTKYAIREETPYLAVMGQEINTYCVKPLLTLDLFLELELPYDIIFSSTCLALCNCL